MNHQALLPLLLALALLPACRSSGSELDSTDAGIVIATESPVPVWIEREPEDTEQKRLEELAEAQEIGRRRGLLLKKDSQPRRVSAKLMEEVMAEKMADAGKRRSKGADNLGSQPKPELPDGFFRVPDQARLKGDYLYFVHREYSTFREAEWIRLAESQPPCPDSTDSGVAPKYWYKPFAEPRKGNERLATPLVIAVTSDAVEHYVKLARDLVDPRTARKTKRSFTTKPLGTTLNYQVEVESEETRATVVLRLSWSEYCGNVCGWGSFTTRVVVVDTTTNAVLECYDNLLGTWIS